MSSRFSMLVVLVLVMISCVISRAEDWPMSGRDATRNSVSSEKNPPVDWQIAALDDDGKAKGPDKNVVWKAELGSMTFGSPVVCGGLVWVCTNNYHPRNPAIKGDEGCLMCFGERDGKFRWQYLTPRTGGAFHGGDSENVGSTPMVEGDRLWFINNEWEVVCLDIGPLLRSTGEPREVWKLDMRRDLKVSPVGGGMGFSMRCRIGASYKGMIYVITGNGVDDFGDPRVPAPDAPNLICLEKGTGRVVWKDNSPGKNILWGQWASPLVAEINGTAQVIAPLGDSWIRSFDAMTGKLIWSFDANPKSTSYPNTRGLLVAAPVLYENRIYMATGQSPDYSSGTGLLWCIDPTRQGDISAELDDGPLPDHRPDPSLPGGPRKGKPNPNSGVIWKFPKADPQPKKVAKSDRMGRSMGGVAAADGLVIATGYDGFVHCLDARTGKQQWDHDLEEEIWSSPLICDGKVYVTTQAGDTFILALSREDKLLARHDFSAAIYCSPIQANGVLYVTTESMLYAIRENAGDRGAASDWPQWRGPERDVRSTTQAGTGIEHRGGNPIFVPTPQDVVEKMLELASVNKDDVVYDLGCGDGRIVVTAAHEYGCRAAGFDIDPECIRLSLQNVRQQGVGSLVEIARKDVFTMDLTGASVVTLYMGREANRRLVPQLQKLKPGARIVSHDFEIEGYPADKVTEVVSKEDGAKHVLYLWTVPLKKK